MAYKLNDLNDAEKSINDLENRLNRFLEVSNIDLKGRRIINAGASRDLADYVTRQELLTAKQDLEDIETHLRMLIGKLDERVYKLEHP